MFHLQSLELVHWDYCQRVSLPLDASIITIAGPNGSGKTTLLDAMRTLLGLKCSQPRDFKTYARHAGANVAWLRAVVDNAPQNRQTSSRPFARRLLYSDQVTLACRIDRNGGDWQRRYMAVEGDVSIEQLTERPDKELQVMGVEAWGRMLADAGLSPAIAKVLSLEQGQTDRLCEYSPRELLRLVFDVFGDQEVLNGYDTAREHQQQLSREMQQAEKELDHSKAQLAELQNKVSNYLRWQHLVNERAQLATEVLPVLEWHGQRQKLTERGREHRRARQLATQHKAERAQKNAELLALLHERDAAQADEARLLHERDAAATQRDSTRDFERPLEELTKREAELLALVDKEKSTAPCCRKRNSSPLICPHWKAKKPRPSRKMRAACASACKPRALATDFWPRWWRCATNTGAPPSKACCAHCAGWCCSTTPPTWPAPTKVPPPSVTATTPWPPASRCLRASPIACWPRRSLTRRCRAG